MASPTGWRLAALCGIATLLPCAGARAQAPQFRYQYAAKVVCGRQTETQNGGVVAQTYATSINIHNPNDSTAVFRKSLAVTLPPGAQQPVRPQPLAIDTLRATLSLATDCVDLRKRRPQLPPFFEGFVLLDSDRSLDVVGVYTVPGGIAVVPVNPRVRQQ